MKGGARVAMGVAAGYLLGRTKKMRLALMVAAAGATGTLGGAPRELLRRGMEQLGSVPELGELANTARTELFNAAKAAAATAASSRITALSERMQDRITGGDADESEQSDEAENGDVDERDRDREETRRPVRRSSGRRRAAAESDDDSTANDTDDDTDDGADDGAEDEAEVRPRRRRETVTARSGNGRSPVRRARR